MEKVNRKEQYKFHSCFSLPIIPLIFSCAIFYFPIGAFNDGPGHIVWQHIGFVIMFWVLPWGLSLWMIILYWPVITIDERGISSKLFGFMFKKFISWEELYEIRVIPTPTVPWTFVANRSLANMGLTKARTRRGQIMFFPTNKIVEVIRKYTDKEIINLPDKL